MDNSNAKWFALSGGASGALWIGSNLLPAEVSWLSAILLLLAGVLLSVALVLLFFWVGDCWMTLHERKKTSDDRPLKLLEAARGASKETLDFVRGASHVEIDLELMVGGAVRMTVRETDIPLWFLRQFLYKSHNRTLCPIRRFPEGTQERRWAIQITALFIRLAYANPYTGGNTSATWVEDMSADKLLMNLPVPADDLEQAEKKE